MPKKNSSSSIGQLAIDPGLRGALALLIDGEFASVADMPLGRKKSGRNQVDAGALSDLLVQLKPQVTKLYCTIELVSAMPGQGVSGMFSMGDSFGVARALAAIHADQVSFVMPGVWKTRMGLNKDKEYSRSCARNMFPAARGFLERKKDEGRAEALLLAAYAYKGFLGEDSSRRRG